MLAALRNLTLAGVSGVAVAASGRTSRAKADGGEAVPKTPVAPADMYVDDGVLFPGDQVLEHWASQIVDHSDNDTEVENAKSELQRRAYIRQSCPQIPPRSAWPEVSDDEVTQHVNKTEEFGLSQERLLTVARQQYIKDEVASAQVETPLGLEDEAREIVEKTASRETVVDDLLSPVTREKYAWYACWNEYFDLCKAQIRMRKAYAGTDEQFDQVYKISQRNTLEHEAFHRCQRNTVAADNDEFLMVRQDRDVMLEKVANALNE